MAMIENAYSSAARKPDAECHATKTPAVLAKSICDRLKQTKDLVVLLGPLTDICGDHSSALLLSQCLYWMQRSRDPEGWFYKSERHWFLELRFRRRKLSNARARLKALGFLEEKIRRTPPVVHYRVDLNALEQALRKYVPKMQIQYARSARNESDRNGQIKRTESADQHSRDVPHNLHESRAIYKEAEITAESNPNTPEKQRPETELPPTPLCDGGATFIQSDRAKELLAKFKLRLKDDMLNASFRAKHLPFDDYDRYFRDTWFVSIQNNVVMVEGANTAVTAEGLRKYDRRLKETFRRIAGIDVQFQMAEVGGDGERA
jgi:hypothetical protein